MLGATPHLGPLKSASNIFTSNTMSWNLLRHAHSFKSYQCADVKQTITSANTLRCFTRFFTLLPSCLGFGFRFCLITIWITTQQKTQQQKTSRLFEALGFFGALLFARKKTNQRSHRRKDARHEAGVMAGGGMGCIPKEQRYGCFQK